MQGRAARRPERHPWRRGERYRLWAALMRRAFGLEVHSGVERSTWELYHRLTS